MRSETSVSQYRKACKSFRHAEIYSDRIGDSTTQIVVDFDAVTHNTLPLIIRFQELAQTR